jgi:hypothetical protein
MPRWLSPVLYDQDLHVDHLNYQHLGCERDEDLQALCPRCHDIKHNGTSDLPMPPVPKCGNCDAFQWGEACMECTSIMSYQRGAYFAESRRQ